MQHEILYQPSYSLLRLQMDGGESISAESGAMVSMTDNIEIQTQAKGGILSALKRSVLGGESFFMNTFTAREAGEITMAPSLPGDLFAIDLNGQSIFTQSGAYLASTQGIGVDTKWGGAKSFFSREGLFLLKISGTGTVFLSSYGGIHTIGLAEGQKYIVDTGHMVAFEDTVQYTVRKVGGLKSFFFSGEGLVCEFTGPGNVLIQTRSEDSFLSWLIPKLPKRGS